MKVQYSIIRFMPDPIRGEFINVGVIAGSDDSSEWQVRQVDNPVRARAIDERNSLEAAWSFIDQVGRSIDDFELSQDSLFEPPVELGTEWLEGLYLRHNNIVQLSPPTPMVADSVDDAMNVLFDEFIVDPLRARHGFQKKHSALAAVRRAYRDRSIQKGENLQERVTLETSHHRERIDFAVTNGQVVQLTHTWSFQIPDQAFLSEQVKAWGWTIGDLKQDGGRVVATSGEAYEVPGNVDVEVVYVPPEPGYEAPSLVDARGVFEKLHIPYRTIDDANEVGEAAWKRLSEAYGGRLPTD